MLWFMRRYRCTGLVRWLVVYWPAYCTSWCSLPTCRQRRPRGCSLTRNMTTLSSLPLLQQLRLPLEVPAPLISICCGFVVQQAAVQKFYKPTTESATSRHILYKCRTRLVVQQIQLQQIEVQWNLGVRPSFGCARV